MTTETDPTIVAQLAEFARMKTPDLVARFTEIFGEPPRCKHSVWLRRNLSWKVQEMHYGGLSPAARERLERLIDEAIVPGVDAPAAVVPPRHPDPDAPPVGTVLARRWRDVEVRVTVTAIGYEYEGKHFRSLSAVAQHVTGTKWNGRAWFGLSQRRRAS